MVIFAYTVLTVICFSFLILKIPAYSPTYANFHDHINNSFLPLVNIVILHGNLYN
jgi:hypothetical protein